MGSWEFWLVAMTMTIAACATVVVPLFWVGRSRPEAYSVKQLLSAVGGVVVFCMSAIVFYQVVGSPNLAMQGKSNVASPHPRMGGADANSPAGDLAQAIGKLETRLQQQPADADGWRLLSQAYAFVGRDEDARSAQSNAERVEAGQTVAPPTSNLTQAQMAEMAATLTTQPVINLKERLKSDPDDRDALALMAEDARRKRDFPTALGYFKHLADLHAMNADLWADYADAVAASRGKLDEESGALIRKAVQADPHHPKALWLLGSWQTERNDHRAALATWQTLSAVLDPESSDAKIIAANIEEAQRAIAGIRDAPAPIAATKLAAPLPSPASVHGEVFLDPKLQKLVMSGATLYVFAKATGQPGPPLAVIRTSVGAWPYRFKLDDAAAMMPGRTLSNFDSVIIEARISRSGSAIAQPGDLRAVSPALNPRATAPLRLVISEQIG